MLLQYRERGEDTNLRRREHVQRLGLGKEKGKVQSESVVDIDRKPVKTRATVMAKYDRIVVVYHGLENILLLACPHR